MVNMYLFNIFRHRNARRRFSIELLPNTFGFQIQYLIPGKWDWKFENRNISVYRKFFKSIRHFGKIFPKILPVNYRVLKL